MRSWGSRTTLFLLFLIGALLPVLAYMQYSWSEELSRLEHKHRTDSLYSAVTQFSSVFDRELANIYQAFHIREEELPRAAEAMKKSFKERFDSAPYASLVKDVYWLKVYEEKKFILERLDPVEEVFQKIDFPTEIEPIRAIMRRKFADEGEQFSNHFSINPLQVGIPGIVVPQHGTEPRRWTVVVLDLSVITEKLLNQQVQLFSGDLPIKYDWILVEDEEPGNVIDRSLSSLSLEEVTSYEDTVSVPFFGLHTRDFSFDWIEGLPTSATEHRWRLYLRHQPGALAAAVYANRFRHICISFGILLLLAGAIVLLQLTTRKAAMWARMQLEFVARIAHELRTPLSVIGFASENLADDVVTDLSKAKTYGKVIHKESRRLSRVVESALLHSRIESGSMEAMEFQPINVIDMVEVALQGVDLSGINLRKDLAPNLPEVTGDVAALTSALQNLFSNAQKHGGERGSVLVKARETTVANTGVVEIQIRDEGPGIASVDLPHIFKPFYRGKAARDNQVEGSGIGLSLVKHVVDSHGGNVRAESLSDGGSCFKVFLPVGT